MSLLLEVAAPWAATLRPPDRRRRERVPRGDLSWLQTVRLAGGPRVSLIDLSPTGAQFETPTPLRPGSAASLTFVAREQEETVALRVLRCEVARLERGLVYRGAGAFDRPLGLLSGADTEPAPFRIAPPEPADAPAGEATGWSRLVVRYMDGRILKGFTQDFHASRPHFHVSEEIGALSAAPVFVPVARLKAIFFVRDFAGNARYVERRTFVRPAQGRKVEITFLDGEVLLGSTLGYRPDGIGFFVTPADPDGNNQKVFVVHAAVRHIRYV